MYNRRTYFSSQEVEEISDPLFDQFPPPPDDYQTDTVPLHLVALQLRSRRVHALYPEARTFLDVGAGTGALVSHARSLGWEAQGIETSELGVREAHRRYGLQLIHTDLETYDGQGQTFDVIHLNHVFEHLTQPVGALLLLKRLMHARSILVIEVPNQFSSWVQEIRTLRHGKSRRSLYSIHHPFFYTQENLIVLLKGQGLSIISTRTHFPERWRSSWSGKLLRTVNFLGDKVGGHGDNIEVMASL